MIKVTVSRNDGRISSVEIKGHSGYAKAGRDIVCAAVSAIAQTALMGLIKYSDNMVDYTRGEDGYLRFTVPEVSGEKVQVIDGIVETMILGIKDVESGYGTFVKLEEK